MCDFSNTGNKDNNKNPSPKKKKKNMAKYII